MRENSKNKDFPCPCCGHLVFWGRPGSHEECPVCYWEDDLLQLRFVTLEGGSNNCSLLQAQKNYQKLGVSDGRFLKKRRNMTHNFEKDVLWRPFDPALDIVMDPPSNNYFEAEVKDGYEDTYPEDLQFLYYWYKNKNIFPYHTSKSKHLEELAQYHNFTLKDLEANRKEKLSRRQKIKRLILTFWYLIPGCLTLLVAYSFAVTGYIPYYFLATLFGYTSYHFLKITIYSFIEIFTKKIAIKEGTIKIFRTYIGRKKIIFFPLTNIDHYQYIVGDPPITLKIRGLTMKRMASIKRKNGIYKVYYIPYTKGFLSLEPLN